MDFSEVLTDSTTLVEYLKSNAKPRESWGCGVEVEVFGFDTKTRKRLDNLQLQTVLQNVASAETDLTYEDDLLVEVRTRNGGKFTVEPGGQIEFSTSPQKSLFDVEANLLKSFGKLRQIGRELNFKFIALGFDPICKLSKQNWFMKRRYRVMKPFMATCGERSWDMMTRTCSIQANFDFDSEADLIKKYVVGNRLAPIVTAIFANSPFVEGKFSGFKSNRALTWLETDNSRCGIAPLALRDNFTLEDFVEYAIDVPMFFVQRDGEVLDDFTGKTFRQFSSNLQIEPNLGDFVTHLTTIFTEARLKNYLEFRSADGGNMEHALSVAALWTGFMDDETSLQNAFKIAPKLNAQEFVNLQKCVAKNGLQAACENVRVLDLAKQIIEIAVDGLRRIAPDELEFLENLQQNVLIDEVSPADILLKKWNGSADEIFALTEL
ncbi:MAG: glutamate--cysteine ligase [Pyrinomonadaceae bacterium]|nr:glutamate--cysteine ligase [Pyrinomonadaceae bacterium]